MLSISGQEVATFWYSQMKRYDFSKPPSILHTNINSGHFSQIVWKNTKFLGVGKATAKSGKIYVVGELRLRVFKNRNEGGKGKFKSKHDFQSFYSILLPTWESGRFLP